MIYRNKRNGALVEVSGEVHGADWEEVKEASPVETEEKPKKRTRKKAEE